MCSNGIDDNDCAPSPSRSDSSPGTLVEHLAGNNSSPSDVTVAVTSTSSPLDVKHMSAKDILEIIGVMTILEVRVFRRKHKHGLCWQDMLVPNTNVELSSYWFLKDKQATWAKNVSFDVYLVQKGAIHLELRDDNKGVRPSQIIQWPDKIRVGSSHQDTVTEQPTKLTIREQMGAAGYSSQLINWVADNAADHRGRASCSSAGNSISMDADEENQITGPLNSSHIVDFLNERIKKYKTKEELFKSKNTIPRLMDLLEKHPEQKLMRLDMERTTRCL
ncbi:hypothetical protein BDZ89DRAFT_1040300 [Hymenopellis radicata]|nr:hypothetical protein BDZ89DRAFT_1040300 [Hymenopellis radicata]